MGENSNLDQTAPIMKKLCLLSILFCCVSLSSAQWQIRHLGEAYHSPALPAISFNDNGIGLAGDSEGNFLRSTDEGESWEAVPAGLEGGIRALQFLNDTLVVGLAVEQPPFPGEPVSWFIRAGDAGLSWEALGMFPEQALYSLSFTDAQNGFIAGYMSIYQTQDGGETWRESWSITEDGGFEFGEVVDIDFPSDSIGYAVGSGRDNSPFGFRTFLLKTENAGQDWQEIFSEEAWDIYGRLSFLSDTLGFWGDGDGFIWKTEDGGGSWIQLQAEYTSGILGMDFPSEQCGAAVGSLAVIVGYPTAFFIAGTQDGGEEWDILIEHGIPLFDVFFINDSTGFVSGDHGLIMKTTSCGGEIGEGYPWELYNATESQAEENRLVSVFPNPFSTHLNLEPLREEASGLLQVYNQQGQLLLSEKYGPLSKTLDTSKLPPGAYWLRVYGKAGQQVVKLIRE